MNIEQQNGILAKVKEVNALALEHFGVDLSNVEIKFNITSDRTLGQAQHRGNRFIMRFHPKAIEYNYEEYRDSTVPHELAHIVCFMKPSLGKNHDSGFKRVATMLGDIRHGAATTRAFLGMGDERTKERHMYRHQGRDIIIGPGQHRKVLSGHVYNVKNGGVLLASEYVGVALFKDGKMVNEPGKDLPPAQTPSKPAAQRKPAQKPATSGMSTAAQVRAHIAATYATQAEAELAFNSIVEAALGFGIRTKGAARQCVKSNIPKCF